MSTILNYLKIAIKDQINYKNFNKYWTNLIKENKIKDKNLHFFIDKYINSESYKYTSKFWSTRNCKHLELLIKTGVENLDHEVSSDYFTWDNFYNSRIKNIIPHVENEKIFEKINIFKIHKNMDNFKSLQHNLLTSLLFKFMKKKDEYKYYQTLSQKKSFLLYNPIIEIDNINISQDLINSIIDIYEMEKIKKISGLNTSQNQVILEIGAGNGRMADAILSLFKNKKYIICDIPLASYFAFYRLNKFFINKKILCAFDISNENDLEKKINDNDIIFILPHQIRFLKKNLVDITLAFDCMHEMDKKTIEFYMNNINNFSKYFFMKVWEKTKVPYSLFNFLNVHNNSYFINKNWELIEKENSLFPSNFFNLSFKIK